MSTIWKTIGNPTLVNIPYFAMPAKGAKCRATYPMTDIKTGWCLEVRKQWTTSSTCFHNLANEDNDGPESAVA